MRFLLVPAVIALTTFGCSDGGPSTADAESGLMTADVREVLAEGAPDVPEVSGGRKLHQSALENAPGYENRPHDPEHDSVERGYRIVDANPDAALTHGQPGFKALMEAVVAAANTNDRARLQSLAIDFTDFSEVLWPEFPESRPITNIEAEHAWANLHRSNLSGATRGAADASGHGLAFNHVEYLEGITPYTNFRLHRGLRIHCTDKNGDPVALDFVRTVVEVNGTWKVYRYQD